MFSLFGSREAAFLAKAAEHKEALMTLDAEIAELRAEFKRDTLIFDGVPLDGFGG